MARGRERLESTGARDEVLADPDASAAAGRHVRLDRARLAARRAVARPQRHPLRDGNDLPDRRAEVRQPPVESGGGPSRVPGGRAARRLPSRRDGQLRRGADRAGCCARRFCRPRHPEPAMACRCAGARRARPSPRSAPTSPSASSCSPTRQRALDAEPQPAADERRPQRLWQRPAARRAGPRAPAGRASSSCAPPRRG